MNIISKNQHGGITSHTVNANEIRQINASVWKFRLQGFVIGIIVTIILNILSSYIYDLIKNLIK